MVGLSARSSRRSVQPGSSEPAGRLMSAHPLLLGFGTNTWDNYWQTRQHVLSRLARRGYQVGYTTPAMSVWEREAPRWRCAKWRSQRFLLDGVLVMYPGRCPPLTHRIQALDHAVVRRQARRFAAYVGAPRTGAPAFAYVFHPVFLPYLDVIELRHVVYHADDNHGALFAGDPAVRDLEQGLIERADRVIAVTEGVAQGLGERAVGKTVIVGNGADVDRYESACRLPVPDDLAAIPRPVIAYAGSLNRKVDFPLVARLAHARPNVHWALIGPVLGEDHMSAALQESLAECRKLPNVRFLGQKSYLELPAYCANVDANAMIYRTDGDGWWRSIYPLKMHECLATGRPLLSADVPAVREFGNVVQMCMNDQDWLDSIDGVATGEAMGTPTARQTVARTNSWDRKVDRIVAELQTLAP